MVVKLKPLKRSASWKRLANVGDKALISRNKNQKRWLSGRLLFLQSNTDKKLSSTKRFSQQNAQEPDQDRQMQYGESADTEQYTPRNGCQQMYKETNYRES